MIGQDIIDRFTALLGPKGVTTNMDDIAPWVSDWRGRYHGAAAAILSPDSTHLVAETVKLAAELGVPLVPQGGNTSMVGGATPPADGSALILSLRRMNRIRSLSAAGRQWRKEIRIPIRSAFEFRFDTDPISRGW